MGLHDNTNKRNGQCKVRLCLNGSSQIAGVDFDQTQTFSAAILSDNVPFGYSCQSGYSSAYKHMPS